jgi:hypothetical protein
MNQLCGVETVLIKEHGLKKRDVPAISMISQMNGIETRNEKTTRIIPSVLPEKFSS